MHLLNMYTEIIINNPFAEINSFLKFQKIVNIYNPGPGFVIKYDCNSIVSMIKLIQRDWYFYKGVFCKL